MGQVLYRKWRPTTFGDVVGQPTTIQTLQRAVKGGRVAHAYLFCGPRGTGKTSTARILAKAVNCLSPQDGEPDNACTVCTAINEGRAMDLIEIDAASNRGIDDIRNLRERVQYTPGEARLKVYIVDEVHMLTEPAFNALLKTLEEPPPHVAFVLATTEAHKIPPTISSRCQRFDFRRITLDDIASRLAHICKGEGVEAEPAALRLIGRASTGGLRDAVNLLEQAIVSYDPPVTEANVRDLLDMGGDEASLKLAIEVLQGKTAEALRTINEVAAQGSDLRQLQRGLIDHLRAAMLTASGADPGPGYTEEDEGRIRQVAVVVGTAGIVHVIKRFTGADLRRDPSSTLALELAVVEAALQPEAAAVTPTQPAVDRRPAPAPATATGRPRPTPARSQPPTRPQPAARSPQSNARPGEPEPASKRPQRRSPQPVAEADLPSDPAARLEVQWDALTASLRFVKGDKFNLKALLVASNGRVVTEDSITLKFPHASHKERMQQELQIPGSRKLLRDAFARVMGRPYDVRVEAADAVDSGSEQNVARNSPLVRAAQAMGAQIVSELEDGEADPGARVKNEQEIP